MYFWYYYAKRVDCKKLLGYNSKDNIEVDLALSEEEKKKKAITGEAKKDLELSEAREKLTVWAKPAGPEPPIPEPKKKQNNEEKKSQ